MLQKRVEETAAPALVFQEADLSVRVVRDVFSAEFERAIVDDPKQHHRLVSFFSRTAPDLVDRVDVWEEKQPLFEAFGVEQVLDSTLPRRIDLPSGGYLVIDYAEALTVIDVNTGSFIGRGKGARLEDTITKTNLEAAEEVVRQLRLRDIGGIIVIDFIDMARARNRDAVLKALRQALDEDRTKTFVVEISPLGLVEMTRQNVTDGVREIMTRPCPTCGGEGVIKSEETLAIEFERRMRDLAKETKAEAVLIQMNPRVSAEFTRDEARVLRAIEEETGKLFVFEGSEGLHLDHFAVVLEGTRDEVLERAVPFRVGEEVHVQIVEPHMYSPGDAVAKIDGYVISVVGGGPYVGEKHLVRIDQAGRTRPRHRCSMPTPVLAPTRPRHRPRRTPRSPRRTAKMAYNRSLGAAAAEADGAVPALRPRLPRPDRHRISHVRDRQDRRKAIPRGGGPVPARRAAARRGWGEGCPAPLLYVDGSNVVDGDELSKVTVEARVLGHERGPKLRIVKFKPKRGYKRRTGHRQELTRIEVTGIKLGARRASSRSAKVPDAEAQPAATTAQPAPVAADAKPAAEAKPAARKAPARKPAAEAKPAARKAAVRQAGGGGQAGGAEAAGAQAGGCGQAGGAQARGAQAVNAQARPGGRQWRIRRASARRATAATRTPSDSASRCSPVSP